MLESIKSAIQNVQVLRFANPRNELKALSELGLDGQEVMEVLSLLQAMPAEMSARQGIDGCFTVRNLNGLPFGPRPTRFSDGHWAVCYTAIERETAVEEIVYHHRRAIFGSKGVDRTAYFHLIRISYSGETLDLRPCLAKWPELLDSEDYSFCQRLAQEAIATDKHGFLTFSAGREGGTNVPVFAREALTDPVVLEVTAFSCAGPTADVRIESSPVNSWV